MSILLKRPIWGLTHESRVCNVHNVITNLDPNRSIIFQAGSVFQHGVGYLFGESIKTTQDIQNLVLKVKAFNPRLSTYMWIILS
jgi:hypothetical protein